MERKPAGVMLEALSGMNEKDTVVWLKGLDRSSPEMAEVGRITIGLVGVLK